GWYYLVCAEGGTGPNHSQVVLRSRDVWGPYVPFAGNPILTQRDLPPDRPAPITNAGHADLVQGPDGSWWATFLATRTYEDIHYNTGRETFLLPVTWRDGWPVILDPGKEIPYMAPGPGFMQEDPGVRPTTGNFTWRDEFEADELDAGWLQVRTAKTGWLGLERRAGWLSMHARPLALDTLLDPSFLARRQQPFRFAASARLETPAEEGTAAGMAAFQGEEYWYFLGVRRRGAGLELFLEKSADGRRQTIATAKIASTPALELRISADAASYSFHYDPDGEGWQP